MAKKSGSVLVVGGGIAGIQAALDLANAGFKVYLVEEKSAIGGTMAQLDKTFPTNDCAMCIMSPKLVECGRHLNIELLTDTELVAVEGEPGDFKVRLHRRPRFVDLAKCTGCGECAKVCPVSIPSEFDEAICDRKAAYRLFAQAFPSAFAIDKRERPPCQISCPAGVHAQGYIALIREGRYLEAYQLIRKNNPFPAICGRVCHHPCEENCRRGEYDDPIAIAALKRFVADYAYHHRDELDRDPPPQKKGVKVAVIGAGPAGLTCANDLAQLGYRVTIFEAEAKPGGMMRMGIPPYRLPREMLDWEIETILKTGVELKTGHPIRDFRAIEALKEEGFKAIFIGVGAVRAKPLKIEGIDLKGVRLGLDFLKEVNQKGEASVGKKVVIIGGGNVAIDVARSALRLGAEEVHLFCLESRSEMPAHEWEITAAVEEGVHLHPAWGPIRILGKSGQVCGVEFKRCISVFDEEGRFRPKFDEKERTEIDGDMVIIAIGQEADLSFLTGSEIKLTPWGTIDVDPVTMATNIEGIFAGGDVVKGPASVVDAVGQGHEAAISIDRYLRGEDLKKGREKKEDLPKKPFPRFVVEKRREVMPHLPPSERIKGFMEVELGYDEKRALAEAGRCLECGGCSECLECIKACEAEAIIHEMVGSDHQIRVGAIIIATGASKFDPSLRYEFGYHRFSNVITSIQFERILAASGPYQGHIQRPGDGKVPKRIAFIQCVGSRDDEHDYCSSVCCMYAIKEAVIAREHDQRIEPTIFFMDIRAFGKGFDKYYERAQEEYGIRFIRARVGKVEEIPESGNLLVYYLDETGVVKEEFDLVVLSVGLVPSPPDLVEKLEIKTDANFIATRPFDPIQTHRDGIYVCGTVAAPKDIPDTVTEASAAAAAVQELLAEARWSETKVKEYPPERDVRGEVPRIGVFVCHCGINIGSVVDVGAVVEYVRTLPNVIYAEDNLFTCSQDTQERIKDAIREHRLNRIVVASCTPRTHEPLFQETLREAGLNPHLFEMANIRDQCSWIHPDNPELATAKAKILVEMAVAKARLLEPLHTVTIPIIPRALIIGGGLAGMISALTIANQGYGVFLIEREDRLGGNLNHLYYTIEGWEIPSYRDELIKKVESHPRIKVYKGVTIDEIDGYVGNYRTRLKNGIELEHGVVILATGAKEEKPDGYLYAEENRVITQRELEAMIWKKEVDRIKRVVMIQCVGSRDDERPYCSRVCCQEAIKNAIRLKEINPKVAIYIFYRDIRTYGLLERYYRKARKLGIIFIRYERNRRPVVERDGDDLRVEGYDPILKERIIINPDLVVLAPPIIPDPESARLSQLLKVPLNEDGFFLEAHLKLRPVDFATDGVFMCGLAHSPKDIKETIAQAKAAAARAVIILSQKGLRASATTAKVDRERCAGCGVCVSVCSFGAPELIESEGRRFSQVNEALCKGCGNCAVACPSGAIDHLGFRSEQTLAMLNIARRT